MGAILRGACKWHPVVVLVAYVYLMSGYGQYLDRHLNYIRPEIQGAI